MLNEIIKCLNPILKIKNNKRKERKGNGAAEKEIKHKAVQMRQRQGAAFRAGRLYCVLRAVIRS